MFLSPPDRQLKDMQRCFIRHIERGGSCVHKPAGLMGGFMHSPFLLLQHFFAVALYSMWLLLGQYPIWLFPLALFECGFGFTKALKAILPFLLSELWK